MNFGKNETDSIQWTRVVYEIRKWGHMTQEQLAKVVNSSITSVSNWETGKRPPRKVHQVLLKKLHIKYVRNT